VKTAHVVSCLRAHDVESIDRNLVCTPTAKLGPQKLSDETVFFPENLVVVLFSKISGDLSSKVRLFFVLLQLGERLNISDTDNFERCKPHTTNYTFLNRRYSKECFGVITNNTF